MRALLIHFLGLLSARLVARFEAWLLDRERRKADRAAKLRKVEVLAASQVVEGPVPPPTQEDADAAREELQRHADRYARARARTRSGKG